MAEVIRRRVALETVMPDGNLVTRVVKLSGGSVRQMIRILNEAVLSAQSRGQTIIDADGVTDAARSLQRDFQRILEEEDYALLAKTSKTNVIKKDDAHMGLLRNTAIMEYNGGDLWYDVNPLIEAIDAYQAACKKGRSVRPRRSRKR